VVRANREAAQAEAATIFASGGLWCFDPAARSISPRRRAAMAFSARQGLVACEEINDMRRDVLRPPEFFFFMLKLQAPQAEDVKSDE